ncbi:MAG: hypothetical protein M1826_007231 [Phylliscum demangeonii]|nr:MAG: hypothetical protein M1826_007231 [Phylliscum demangeonii]
MALLYYYSICMLFLLATTALYLTRTRWQAHLPPLSLPTYVYSRLPGSFASDMEAGFSSTAFDLTGNVAAGDARAGLDDGGKREVQRIMRAQRVSFDDARRIYVEQRFAREGIGADGVPRDPKFVSFS